MSDSRYRTLRALLAGFVLLVAVLTAAAVVFGFPYPGALALVLALLTLLAGVYSLLLLPAFILPRDLETQMQDGAVLRLRDAQNVAIAVLGSFVCLVLISSFYLSQAGV